MKNTLKIIYQWGKEKKAEQYQIEMNVQEIINHGVEIKETQYRSYINNNTIIRSICKTYLHATKYWCYSEIQDELLKTTEKKLTWYNTKKEAQTYARGFKRRIYKRYPGIKTYSEDL